MWNGNYPKLICGLNEILFVCINADCFIRLCLNSGLTTGNPKLSEKSPMVHLRT